jgi:hypothetical protein
LEVFEQLFRFRVVGCKRQGAPHLGTSQNSFFLLEVDARKHRANLRGIASRKRRLEFLDCVIKLAAPMIDFRQAAVRGGVGGLDAQNTLKFFFGGVKVPRG